MQNNAFNHYEVYGRKGAHKRRSKERRPSLFDVHAELMRASGAHPHIENPRPPVLLFGAHPDAVIEELVAQAAQAVGLRIDAPILLAGVMTWPVAREEVENSEVKRRKYLAWRADAMASAQRLWGDRLRCIVEHVDEAKLHLHYWVTPQLHPDRRLSISDVDFGRRAAKAVKDAGGNGQAQKAASTKAMIAFQDRYWQEVGSEHDLARLGPRRLRFTSQQWADHRAERKRVAEAWLTLHSEHAKLQAAANAHVATRIAEGRAAADAAAEAATKAANARIVETETTALGLLRDWKSHAAALNGVIENHKSVIAEQAERLQELEALLREHGLPTGPEL